MTALCLQFYFNFPLLYIVKRIKPQTVWRAKQNSRTLFTRKPGKREKVIAPPPHSCPLECSRNYKRAHRYSLTYDRSLSDLQSYNGPSLGLFTTRIQDSNSWAPVTCLNFGHTQQHLTVPWSHDVLQGFLLKTRPCF